MAVMERVAPAELPQRKERSPWADAAYQLMQNRLAVISLGFILVLVLLAVFADVITPFDFATNHLKDNYALPGTTYWFGADNLGRDILTRTIYGTRVSVSVAVIAATVSLGIGLVYGIVSGYFGGRVDELMMRFVDFLYGLPIIIVVILMQVFFKAMARSGNATGIWGGLIALNKSLGGMLFIFIAIGALNWIGMARIARGQVLSYKEKEFIEAARSVGAGPTRIVFRHLLPNVIGPCIVQETLQIPGYILLEAFLSFIGLGVDAPTPSWGIMIQEGYQALRSYSHVIVAPAAALTLTVLAFNFLGDGLRDAFDPRLRSS